MNVRLLPVFFIVYLSINSAVAQVNVGREYGNPKMPFVLSHLPEKNQRMLTRGNSPRHNIFTVILCFKWACRKTVARNEALHAISFSKFKKRVEKNARKGMYEKTVTDSIPTRRPAIKAQPDQIVQRETTQPVVQRPKVDAPVLKSDSLIVLNEFLFETNSSTLKVEHFSALDSIMDFLLEHPSLEVKISGHTDNTGRESHNKTLSTKRAEVVAEYLIENGVSQDRVTFEGFGSSKPIAPNSTDVGRNKNRRVELLIHDKR